METKKPLWTLTDHCCMTCGGRILKLDRVEDENGEQVSVFTGGGNPMYRCADCGRQRSDIRPGGGICWCAFKFRGQTDTGYRCVNIKQAVEQGLSNALRACGINPDTDRIEVGIVSERARPEKA